MLYSLVALLVLVLDIIAIVQVFNSGAQPLAKVLWILLILALPILGMLLFFMLGPGTRASIQ